MNTPYRLALSIIVTYAPTRPGPIVSAEAQIWDDTTLIKRIDLASLKGADGSGFDYVDCLEGFSTVAARTAARVVEDAFYQAVDCGRTQPIFEVERDAPAKEGSQHG